MLAHGGDMPIFGPYLEADQNIPLGRVGTPEDIAGVVLYLCSRAGAYVSGHTIPVAGGLNAAVAAKSASAQED